MPVIINEITITAEVDGGSTRSAGGSAPSGNIDPDMKLKLALEDIKRIFREKNER